jgi:hypothetical protein
MNMDFLSSEAALEFFGETKSTYFMPKGMLVPFNCNLNSSIPSYQAIPLVVIVLVLFRVLQQGLTTANRSLALYRLKLSPHGA